MYASGRYINIISLIPNNINKKINISLSDFCPAGSSLQFVTTDSQKFCHLYSFNFFLFKGGLLATSHVNFSTSSTIDVAGDAIHNVCALYCRYFASAREHAETCASYCHRHEFRYLENVSDCTFTLRQQKSFLCARSRIQQRSTSRRAPEVASARVP